jgi:hypothetical protein
MPRRSNTIRPHRYKTRRLLVAGLLVIPAATVVTSLVRFYAVTRSAPDQLRQYVNSLALDDVGERTIDKHPCFVDTNGAYCFGDQLNLIIPDHSATAVEQRLLTDHWIQVAVEDNGTVLRRDMSGRSICAIVEPGFGRNTDKMDGTVLQLLINDNGYDCGIELKAWLIPPAGQPL